MQHELDRWTRITAPSGQAVPLAKLEADRGESELRDEGRIDGESRDAWLAWSQIVDETAVRIDAHELTESILSRHSIQQANPHRRRWKVFGGMAAACMVACMIFGAILRRDDPGQESLLTMGDSTAQQTIPTTDLQQERFSTSGDDADWMDELDAELAGMEAWLNGFKEGGKSVAQLDWEAEVAQCLEAIEQQNGEIW